MPAEGPVLRPSAPENPTHNTPDLQLPQTPRKRPASAPNPSPYRAASISPGHLLNVTGDVTVGNVSQNNQQDAENNDLDDTDMDLASLRLLASRRLSWAELSLGFNLERIVREILNCVDAGLVHALRAAHYGIVKINRSESGRRFANSDHGIERMQAYLKTKYLQVLSKFQSYMLNKFFLYESSLERGHWLRHPEEEEVEFSEEAAKESDKLGVSNRNKAAIIERLVTRRQELAHLEAKLKAMCQELRDLEARADETDVPEIMAKLGEIESLNSRCKETVAWLTES